jgi:hypothetical protein
MTRVREGKIDRSDDGDARRLTVRVPGDEGYGLSIGDAGATSKSGEHPDAESLRPIFDLGGGRVGRRARHGLELVATDAVVGRMERPYREDDVARRTRRCRSERHVRRRRRTARIRATKECDPRLHVER